MLAHDHLSPSSRRVRRLHLHAERDEDASHAVTLLADALRTASIPGADDGRLVVIRKLALGRIPHGVTAASLALHIERVTGEMVARAVPYLSPAAAQADAVASPGRGAAIVTLARIECRSLGAREWFWPALVQGWQPDAAPHERFRLLLMAAQTIADGVKASATIVESAARAGRDDLLLPAIDGGLVREWKRRAEWTWTRDDALPPLRLESITRYRGLLTRAASAWGVLDERTVWLATMLAVAARPSLLVDRSLPARVAAALEAVRMATGQPASGASSSDRERTAADVVADIAPSPSTGSRFEPSAVNDAQPDAFIATTAESGVFTACAGLLFIVPILARLGFARYVADEGEALEEDFPYRLLAFVGHRAGLKADDPLTKRLRIDIEAMTHPAPDVRYVRWLTAVRRWSRRHARMGLTSLVRRPGSVSWSDTHIDVQFRLSQLDVRIRRVALDIDPGWVPWLGRIVAFHYVEQHDATC